MQTEMKSLTKREKRLLLALVVFGLLAAAILLVIIPFYNNLDAKTSELNTAQLNKQQIDATLASESVIRENHDTVVSRESAAAADYLGESLGNDIGRMLTELCEQQGLSPIDLKLSNPKDFTAGTVKTGAQAGAGSGGSSGSAPAPNSVFLVVSAVMTVKGEYENLKSLLDSVEQTTYLRVSGVTFTSSGGIVSQLDKITINFEVTMLKNMTMDS